MTIDEDYYEYKQECIDSGDKGHIMPYSEWVKLKAEK